MVGVMRKKCAPPQKKHIFLLKLKKIIINFSFAKSLSLHVGFSAVVESRGYASFGGRASHCGGFSCCREWALGRTGFCRCGSGAHWA